MFVKSLLLFAAILFIAIPSYAAPSVSGVAGTLSDGASVSISGSGFGTKATAKPVLWDTFEGGADSSADIGSWSTFAATNGSVVRRGSRSAQAGCGATGVNKPMGLNITMGSSGKLFASFWRRYTFNITSSNQLKFFRYYKDVGNSAFATWLVPYLTAGQEICENTQWYGSGKEPVPNTWYNETFRLGGSGVFTYDRWSDQGAGGNLVNRSDSPFFCSGQGSFNTLYIDNYGKEVPSGGLSYVDDVYIDNTWSRVMIGNNASFASCTKFEMQIPTAWSSSGNSITATFNRGNFAAGSTAYLYVVDANNNASPGYKITIGGSGGGTTPPPAPTNLHVVQ